jgi:ABC-2 type transport system ATP-binding protein
MSINVRNLTKKYNNQLAVNNVSFEVNKGEIVGFLGPNGAGKSTTMKILTGYLKPTGGYATLDETPIEIENIETKKKVGYLPEHNPLYHDMYVKQYLSHVGSMYGIKGKTLENRVNEIIELVGLLPEKSKKIAQLSKGYKQRVGLAQALIHDPEVLILDEPTTGLDPNQLVEIRSLIKEVGKSKTVILSTHIMQEVEAICNRVIIINKGSIVVDESLENLIANGQSLEDTFRKLTN